ncbi:MAG: LUD domain-containing protein [Bacteroidetes bacterium]|nr:LUD domain-containing protein [Bacteroidota bacterium]
MQNINDYKIHPREVADKSSKEVLRKAIRLALDTETDALRLNTQTFNTNKYKTIQRLADYEGLKDRARRIKEESIENRPGLVGKLTNTIRARGGEVFLAKSGKEAADYVRNVCLSHDAKLIVKAKSITSEEIGLNHELLNAGIEVAETDLAEFILQVSREQPSHIVAPAIHRSRESISELFKRNFRTDRLLETGEELTEFARDILRKKFLSADVGITGANLIAAEEGALLLVESEGNIRLTTQLPAVHIAIAGIEKVIASKKDFGVFIELLAASGTGQALTSYTNILQPPIDSPVLNLNGREDREREFYLVLVDNGRTKMREDEDLKEALYCIRCSACMNSCANFQAVGGHAFGGECYTGGIGGAWTLGTSGSLEKARFAELCTGCSRCVPNCPVKIDIPRLNTAIKNRLTKAAGGPSTQQRFFGHFADLARLAEVAPRISNKVNNLAITRVLMENVVGVDKRRSIPSFANETLEKQYRRYRINNKPASVTKSTFSHTVLFADVFTNYNNPEVGMSTVRVFDKLGLPIALSEVLDDGRGLQSQGLVEKAEQRARKLAAYLEKLIDEGKEIIVAEPSVLSMFRRDYEKLLDNNELFGKIAKHSFDPIEYLNGLIVNGSLDLSKHLIKPQSPFHRIFYHAHCQLKTIGGGNVTPEFFRRVGFTVDISNVECCGMAGSFGYKKEYYDISKRVGDDLISQINATLSLDKGTVLLASGTSCREQIGSEISATVYHPMEFLDTLVA